MQELSLYKLSRKLPIPGFVRKALAAWEPFSEKNAGAERYYFQYDRSKVLESIWVGHFIIYSKFLQIAEQLPTLDLACGCGAGTKLISESLKTKVIGVDYSTHAINYAKKHNRDSFTEYYVLDLNEISDLDRLKKLIQSHGLRQVFFIEGIEHIRDPNEVIGALLQNGIERIFVSTPFENEGTPPQNYHVYPFTPSIYRTFAARFGSKVYCYCKPTLVDDIRTLLSKGSTKDDLMKQFFTLSQQEAANYLIEIDRSA